MIKYVFTGVNKKRREVRESEEKIGKKRTKSEKVFHIISMAYTQT